ncbi:nucleotide sugar epimerase [Fulvimarina pelagi HTCC2506]|uniref:Nucleotide sugar epimerase n=1 Tax=Fulvimarina pelagi HTCC2506 TaxID=314231 RepID=Q0G455_9HYPH|nr:NAD(P)-dependent oxidoreductase [Fulvimarina pelagi]EAU41626.1 nucleotide sugar epimerase [Fulvimarina pelagi HTCC2506]
MSIAIFGGLGHVGSWVAHDLAARGEDVVIFDAGSGDYAALGLDHLVAVSDRLAFEPVDVLDVHTLFERIRAHHGRIEAIVWGVAVIAGPTFAQRPFRNIQINTVGMLNALEAARIFEIGTFVNLSSGAVYGDLPGGQTEDLPAKATDLYGATKVANEALALQYGETYGIDVRNARLYFVYGPGRMPSRMHPLYRAMFGALEGLRDVASPSGGDQALDWTHVRDTAKGIVALLDARNVSGEAFNISSGVAVNHRNIMQAAERIAGGDHGMSIGPGSYFLRGAPLDISKAKQLLNFTPRFTEIEEGLRDYADWINKQR